MLCTIENRIMRDEEMTQGSQHSFPKGRLCITNLMAFYNAVTTSVDKGWATDVNLPELVQGL